MIYRDFFLESPEFELNLWIQVKEMERDETLVDPSRFENIERDEDSSTTVDTYCFLKAGQ